MPTCQNLDGNIRQNHFILAFGELASGGFPHCIATCPTDLGNDCNKYWIQTVLIAMRFFIFFYFCIVLCYFQLQWAHIRSKLKWLIFLLSTTNEEVLEGIKKNIVWMVFKIYDLPVDPKFRKNPLSHHICCLIGIFCFLINYITNGIESLYECSFDGLLSNLCY